MLKVDCQQANRASGLYMQTCNEMVDLMTGTVLVDRLGLIPKRRWVSRETSMFERL